MQSACRRVGVQNVAFQIFDKNRVRGAVENGAEKPLAVLQFVRTKLSPQGFRAF